MVGGGGPEDTASEFEKSLRLWVGVCQMITPGVLFGALVFRLVGLEVPAVLSGIVTVTVGLIGVVAYLSGTWLCFRMPGNRRILAIISYTMVVLSSLSMMGMETAARQAELPEARLRTLQSSASYKRIERQLLLATEDLDRLIYRTSLLPGDQRTQAAAAEVAKEAARKEIARLGDVLQVAEAHALGSTVLQPNGPFDLFGHEFSETLRWIMIVLLTIGNEITLVALLLPLRKQRPNGVRILTDGVVKRQLAGPISVEARGYLDVSKRLGKGGKVAGYRKVSNELGISSHHARRLMKQCVESGLIRNGRPAVRTEPTVESHPFLLRVWLSINKMLHLSNQTSFTQRNHQ